MPGLEICGRVPGVVGRFKLISATIIAAFGLILLLFTRYGYTKRFHGSTQGNISMRQTRPITTGDVLFWGYDVRSGLDGNVSTIILRFISASLSSASEF